MFSNGPSDLFENDHTVFDIGLKRDSMDIPTFDGYMRDLTLRKSTRCDDL